MGARARHFHAEHLGSLLRVFPHLGEVVGLGGKLTNVCERVFHKSCVNGDDRFRTLILRVPKAEYGGNLHATGESCSCNHQRCNHSSNAGRTHDNLTDTITMNIR